MDSGYFSKVFLTRLLVSERNGYVFSNERWPEWNPFLTIEFSRHGVSRTRVWIRYSRKNSKPRLVRLTGRETGRQRCARRRITRTLCGRRHERRITTKYSRRWRILTPTRMCVYNMYVYIYTHADVRSWSSHVAVLSCSRSGGDFRWRRPAGIIFDEFSRRNPFMPRGGVRKSIIFETRLQTVTTVVSRGLGAKPKYQWPVSRIRNRVCLVIKR